MRALQREGKPPAVIIPFSGFYREPFVLPVKPDTEQKGHLSALVMVLESIVAPREMEIHPGKWHNEIQTLTSSYRWSQEVFSDYVHSTIASTNKHLEECLGTTIGLESAADFDLLELGRLLVTPRNTIDCQDLRQLFSVTGTSLLGAITVGGAKAIVRNAHPGTYEELRYASTLQPREIDEEFAPDLEDLLEYLDAVDREDSELLNWGCWITPYTDGLTFALTAVLAKTGWLETLIDPQIPLSNQKQVAEMLKAHAKEEWLSSLEAFHRKVNKS